MLREALNDLFELTAPLRSEPETERTADALHAILGSIEAAARAGKKVKGRLPMPVPRDQALRPQHAKMTEAELSFSFTAPTAGQARVEDLFCEIQVQISGWLKLRVGQVRLEDHWRIDTYVKPKKGKAPREAHPRFHFQRGGHAQDAFSASPGFVPGPALAAGEHEWRGWMQYPGPRIAVLPYCPATAIDLIISQHDGPLWQRLLRRPEYAKTIERCRARIWDLCADALTDDARRQFLLRYC